MQTRQQFLSQISELWSGPSHRHHDTDLKKELINKNWIQTLEQKKSEILGWYYGLLISCITPIIVVDYSREEILISLREKIKKQLKNVKFYFKKLVKNIKNKKYNYDKMS